MTKNTREELLKIIDKEWRELKTRKDAIELSILANRRLWDLVYDSKK